MTNRDPSAIGFDELDIKQTAKPLPTTIPDLSGEFNLWMLEKQKAVKKTEYRCSAYGRNVKYGAIHKFFHIHRQEDCMENSSRTPPELPVSLTEWQLETLILTWEKGE